MAYVEQQQRIDQMPVTQLEFYQAMRDFKTMFPELDEDVIEVVLRANNGAVDVTIDQLLEMNVDIENQQSKRIPTNLNQEEVPPRYSPQTPPPSYQQAVPYSLRPENLIDSSFTNQINEWNTSSNESLRVKFRWNPPMLGPLPSSFLRIDSLDGWQSRRVSLSSSLLQQKMEENERQRQLSKDSENQEAAQFLEDERIAIFLQNEEFVRELRLNKEFMSTLQLDSKNSRDTDGSNASHHDDIMFMETLKNMGKGSRRKFAQLARLFSRRKRRSFTQLLVGHEYSTNPSRDNLLSGDDNYRELKNETSDSEDHHKGCESNERRRDVVEYPRDTARL